MSKTDEVSTLMAFVGNLTQNVFKSATAADSLVEFTRPTRVEPVVLMDDRILHVDYMGDLMQSLSSIFAGYYLQAVALQVNVGRVDVVKLLDAVNPDTVSVKSVMNSHLRSNLESADSYEFGLPVPGQPVGVEHFGLERRDDSVKFGDDATKVVREAVNLSVGKIIEVEVESEGQRAVFPVQIRLLTTTAPPDGITHILTLGNKNVTMKERFHAWRSGQLEFIRDIVMAQDIISAHKKGMLNDKSGIYHTSVKRRRKNFLASIMTGSPSVATASNIIVISDATRKEVEREIGGRLKDFRTREKIFSDSYAMLLVVVDPDWDNITVYHRSVETPTELTPREIKNPSKSGGPDVAEILKAYQLGNNPTI